MIEDEMGGWHYWLNGHEFEPALGDGEGQASLACCSSWGFKELDLTELLITTISQYIKKQKYQKVENVFKGTSCSSNIFSLEAFTELWAFSSQVWWHSSPSSYILCWDKEKSVKISLFFFSLLEDNCFIILCWFLPYINMNQSQVSSTTWVTILKCERSYH